MKHSFLAAALAVCLLTAPCAAVETSAVAATGATAAATTSKPSSWALADLQTAIKAGLVPSELQGQWQRPITREEFADLMTALMHSRGYGYSAVTSVNPFSDTFSENARRLYTLGVMSGTSLHTFSPDAFVTREEGALFAYRLACTRVLPNPYPEQIATYTYQDNDHISPETLTAVSFCSRCKILGGAGNNAFSPQTTMTVEQAALMMLRLQQYAAAMVPSSLTMTAGGVPMLYSDNPEELIPRKFETYGIYTAETDLTDGQIIDAEYYHLSYMGSYQPMILGIAATNSSKTAATIDIVKRGVGIGTDGDSISEECYRRFFSSSLQDSVTIKAGETKLILQDTLPGGSVLNARIRLQAHGTGLNIRLVALKQLVSGDTLAKLPRGLDDGNGRTAGLFRYSERTTTIDASKVTNFTLCGNTASLWTLNPGEYPQSVSDPLAVFYHGQAHMEHFINGNYATIYHLRFTNTTGKSLYIRPDDPSSRNIPGRYLLYTTAQGWHCITATAASPVKLSLPAYASMDFLLLGGNYGNVGFHIA